MPSAHNESAVRASDESAEGRRAEPQPTSRTAANRRQKLHQPATSNDFTAFRYRPLRMVSKDAAAATAATLPIAKAAATTSSGGSNSNSGTSNVDVPAAPPQLPATSVLMDTEVLVQTAGGKRTRQLQTQQLDHESTSASALQNAADPPSPSAVSPAKRRSGGLPLQDDNQLPQPLGGKHEVDNLPPSNAHLAGDGRSSMETL